MKDTPLIYKLISRIELYSYPKNPKKHVKEKKRKPIYFFVSTKVIPITNRETGVVTERIIGISYKKGK